MYNFLKLAVIFSLDAHMRGRGTAYDALPLLHVPLK